MLFNSELLTDVAPLMLEQSLFDRTGTFHSLDRYTVIQPIPKPEAHDFRELCLARAKEISKTNKTINLFWSGGADSTLMLLLVSEIVPDDQIRIICSGDSFSVNRYAGDLVLKKYQIDSPCFYPEKIRHFMSDDQLIVTGIGMDMLTYGFDVEVSQSDDLDDFVKFMQLQTAGTEQQYRDIFQKLEQASGQPCTTVKQYSRLKNMVLCWQPEMLHIGRLAQFGIYGEHFINFYQTTEFQQWSMASNETESDQFGNKHIVSDFIRTIDADCVPDRKVHMPMMHRFAVGETQKITDDWQYF